ncbi:MAG: hypothetical protein HY924_10690 [Elusimicrobia bacterium]|nr:hypothetical protein [Elusimicrobiota bacterium]
MKRLLLGVLAWALLWSSAVLFLHRHADGLSHQDCVQCAAASNSQSQAPNDSPGIACHLILSPAPKAPAVASLSGELVRPRSRSPPLA